MSYNFIRVDRDQQFLLPENMRDWLPEGDLAYFVIDIMAQMDLSAFYAPYRQDGWGAAAYDPAMMVTLLTYAYCVDERSSRKIERLCCRDVAFRVIAGNHIPDHATIARFRRAHEDAVQEIFTQVLELCEWAGLIDTSLAAVDGTKIKAVASLDANRSHASLSKEYEELARRILAEAEAVDACEDRLYGPGVRGEELRDELRDPKARQARIRERLALMEAQAEVAAGEQRKKIDEREKRRQAGEKVGRRPLPPEEVSDRFLKKARVNTTDPDSRIMKGARGFVQGSGAQVAVTKDQIIVATRLTNEEADWHQLYPIVELAAENLAGVGVQEPLGCVVADAGYGCEDNLKEAERREEESLKEGGAPCPHFLIATKGARELALELAAPAAQEAAGSAAPSIQEEHPADHLPAERETPENLTVVERMERKLKTAEGRETYAKRGMTVEPVFGQLKEARGFERFMRRGLRACQSEFLLMCATHNLLKLWRLHSALTKKG